MYVNNFILHLTFVAFTKKIKEIAIIHDSNIEILELKALKKEEIL